jgi:hypothetical protein
MMKKSVSLFAVIGAFASLTALAGAQTPAKTKLVDVWTCPINMTSVPGKHVDDGKTVKGVVVGKYRVHFCCGGCPEEFAKLSAKDKLAKATAAAKADAAAKTPKKS